MEILYKLALSFVPHLSPAAKRVIIAHFGCAEALFRITKEEISELSELNLEWLRILQSKPIMEAAEKELDFTVKNGIKILTQESPDYPKRLLDCEDAPFLLFYKGSANLRDQRIISIVGTRKSTSYGQEICRVFLKQLKTYQPLIVSGLAHGIDGYAHRGALEHKIPTVAVLGHGLDSIYPYMHHGLANKILEDGGGLLSEFPSNTRPNKYHFPMRNRIIAGMAHATVVVEATHGGGAMITAKHANQYNREVFAFPGNIFQESSKGCNYLIKSERAHAIRGAKDLAYFMCWDMEGIKLKQKARSRAGLDTEEIQILDFLTQNGPATVDLIYRHSTLGISELPLALLQLELKDWLMQLPGKVYTIKN